MSLRWFVFPILMAAGLIALGGNASAATVTSSALDSIVILPNDRPTLVDVDSDLQFVATGATADGQTLSGITFTWTTDGDVGTINENGMFTGSRGGIGRVTATSGEVTASVGVVVRGVAAAPEPVSETIPPSSTTLENVNATSPEAIETPATNESTNEGTESVEAASAESAETSCTTIRAWVWVIILLAYIIGMVAYFLSLGESRTFWWWGIPLLITAAPFVLFFATRCASLNLWVPWTTGVLAFLLGLFYLRVLRPTESTALDHRT